MIAAALDSVVDPLRAAGLKATADPRNLAVPGALVVLQEFEPAGQCVYDVTVDVVLVAAGPANGDALRTLDRLDDLAEVAVGAHSGELVGYEHPATGDLLAAIRIPHTTTIHTA